MARKQLIKSLKKAVRRLKSGKEKLVKWDMKKMKKEMRESEQQTGLTLRKRLKSQAYWQIKSKKQDRKWLKNIMRCIKRLERKNPDFIEMDVNHMWGTGGPDHWIDVFIKLPHLFKWKWRWVTTFESPVMYDENVKDALEYGMEYPNKNPADNADKFDIMYFDTAFTEDNVLPLYNKWIKIFIPQFYNRVKIGTYE